MNGKKVLVVLNFTGKPASVNTGINMSNARPLIDNYGKVSSTSMLRPYEAVVYQL
jgi:oligo-1,6-glucosidase